MGAIYLLLFLLARSSGPSHTDTCLTVFNYTFIQGWNN